MISLHFNFLEMENTVLKAKGNEDGLNPSKVVDFRGRQTINTIFVEGKGAYSWIGIISLK